MDRALFLARNLAADTTEILALTGQIQERLEESLKKQRYRQYVDSAQVKLDVEDFIGARYFASQALAEFDNSPEAAKILNKANTALQNLASHKEMVDSRLWQIDSLLSYGDFDQALTLAKTLAQFAGDDDRIKQALKKAEFEQIRNTASRAYTNGDLQGALTSLDSALVLFPGHNACLDLRKQINRATYLTAQRLFKAGDLNQAILYWEKVEQLAGDYQSVRKYLINGYKFMGVELYSQNKLKEAVVIWQKAARLNVNNDEIIEYIKRTKNEIRRLEELSYEQQ
jgi:tetratricopeptide (TPR) repeat protein